MAHESFSNIGAYIDIKPSANLEILAGGAGGSGVTADNTATDGASIDKFNPGGANGAGNASAGIFNSCRIALVATATLAASKKLTVIVNLKESNDDGSTDAYTAVAAAQQPNGIDSTTPWLTITDGGAGGTQCKAISTALDLTGSKRYQRPTITADLSAANTDIAQVACFFVVGGANILPAP